MINFVPVSPSTVSTQGSLSPLESYKLLVGDIDKPIDADDDSLYHTIMVRERKSKHWYIISAIAIYTSIATQIILCLGIAVGVQRNLTNNQISLLAGVNTGVAATIGVLKALGLPDKKGVERRKLQQLAGRIRTTTRKLRAGLPVDAVSEAEEVNKTYEQTEDDAQFQAADISAAATTGLQTFKKR